MMKVKNYRRVIYMVLLTGCTGKYNNNEACAY